MANYKQIEKLGKYREIYLPTHIERIPRTQEEIIEKIDEIIEYINEKEYEEYMKWLTND